MIKEEVKITNKLGLHARPAALIAKAASAFSSDIKFVKSGIEVNAKSIMGIMMLAAEYNSKIVILINGEDEQDALKKIKDILKQKFE
ncbi:MAG: HPr family phosphocarrier protein [Elusimicrobiaceae bacterium]|nr:HPr family phosphocarrier protein [Elusimicrobiaceae bacterium]MBT3955166.1 HPr family phosphocarrier protein [Elusimicrobiaceae bacterium]MBT4008681.1 HPr family phosphocarrier protein [Elusimicrobiaceae bacterium]MBT4402479.1 HPr family phosphocarrier protein [Elusimicrobiaceae bacterium]MBT4440157.1 HPr family phosphocarrier protein [Elusimicrobiaceae bacterium]